MSIKETDELLVAVARHAVADDLAVEHADRGKQGSGSVRTDNPILVMDPKSAEFSKYASDATLALKLSLQQPIEARDKCLTQRPAIFRISSVFC